MKKLSKISLPGDHSISKTGSASTSVHFDQIDSTVENILAHDSYGKEVAGLMASILTSITFLEAEEGQRVLDVALSRVARFEQSREFMILAGAVHFSTENRKLAFEKFVASASMPMLIGGRFRGVNCVRPWSAVPTWLSPKARRNALRGPIIWMVPGEPTDLTVVTACDPVYFVKYARSFLQSLSESSTPVHFHVIGWTDACSDVLVALTQIRQFSLSREPYLYSQDKTYFATARFLRALEFIRSLGPIFLSDIDNTFTRSPESVKQKWASYDVALKSNQWAPWLPWLAPNAGYVYLNETPAALHFAALLQNYVDHLFSPNSSKNWYFDQLLLNEVRECSEASVLKLTRDTLVSRGRQQ